MYFDGKLRDGNAFMLGKFYVTLYICYIYILLYTVYKKSSLR